MIAFWRIWAQSSGTATRGLCAENEKNIQHRGRKTTRGLGVIIVVASCCCRRNKGVFHVNVSSVGACCRKFIVCWWGRCYLTLNLDVPFMVTLQVLWSIGIALNKCNMPSTYTLKKLYRSLYALFCALGGREERRRGMEHIPFINIVLWSVKNLVKLLMIVLLLGFGLGLFHQILRVITLMDLLSLWWERVCVSYWKNKEINCHCFELYYALKVGFCHVIINTN